jgi:hypothetical protein
MWQLGAAALRTIHVVDRLKGMMRAALALARLAVFLDRKHGSLLRADDNGKYGYQRNVNPSKHERRAFYPPNGKGGYIMRDVGFCQD